MAKSSGSGAVAGGAHRTLVGTAEMSGLDPQAYLPVLPDRIANHPIRCIGERAPWRLRHDAA